VHKIVPLALLVKTARTVPFTAINAVLLAIFVFFFNKLAIKTLHDTLNDQFL
jgi:hypothetical protein